VTLVISLSLAACLLVVLLGALWLQRRTLLEQALTDPLTGAFNRRHMDWCLTTAMERRQRIGEPASLLLFDVDHFKHINDALGHAAGDRALKGLVELVSARARKLDVLFRIGGEEFLLLLPGAAHHGALAVAENLRRMVAAADLLDGWRLSISVGVSELQDGQSVSSWIEDADVALYRAKRDGRNRVRVSGGVAVTCLVRPAHQ